MNNINTPITSNLSMNGILHQNTRFLNDFISRSFEREQCIYIRPVDDVNNNISNFSSISSTEFRKITGRKVIRDACFVNLPSELIKNKSTNERDAILFISDIYSDLVFKSNFESSPMVKRFEIASRLSFKAYILSYLFKKNINDLHQIILSSFLFELGNKIGLSQKNILKSLHKDCFIQMMIKFTNLEEAIVIENMLSNLIDNKEIPCFQPDDHTNSIRFLSKGWEDMQHFILDSLFRHSRYTKNIM